MSVRTIAPTRGLKGEVTIPGDKSISHRSIMLGSIALGTTEITHFLEGADCLSTIDCFRKMGVEIERKPSSILVHGKGLRGLTAPASTLNVGNSGTTTRLISGILSGQNFATTLSGDDSLNSRPMKRIMTPEEKVLLQAKHRLEEIEARNRKKERNARTRRLIQEGAILESIAPHIKEMDLDTLKRELMLRLRGM